MDYELIKKLLTKAKQLKTLQLEVYGLQNVVQKELIANGTENVETKYGKLKLVKNRGKASVTSSQETEELEQAIHLERQEMAQANAKQLYELQKQRDLAEIAMDRLMTNEWVEELEAKLDKAKQHTVQTSSQNSLKLQIDLPKLNVLEYVDHKWYELKVMELKSLQPKPIGRSALNKFLEQYFESAYYEGFTLDDALADRISKHIAYWEARA